MNGRNASSFRLDCRGNLNPSLHEGMTAAQFAMTLKPAELLVTLPTLLVTTTR